MPSPPFWLHSVFLFASISSHLGLYHHLFLWHALDRLWDLFGGLFMFMEIFKIFFKTIFKKWPQAYTHSILDTRLKKGGGGSGSQKLKRQHRSKHPITTGLQTTNTVNKNKILGQMLIRSNASFSFWFFFSFIAATLELLSGIILCCALFLYLFAALFHSLEFNL